MHRLLAPMLLACLLPVIRAAESPHATALAFIALAQRLPDEGAPVEGLDLAADGTRALTIAGGRVAVRRIVGEPPAPAVTMPGTGIVAAVFAPDGLQVAISDGRDEVVVRAVGDGREVRRLVVAGPRGYPWGISEVAWSPDGRLIAARGGSDYSLEGRQAIIWEVAGGRELARVDGAYGYGLAFSPDSGRLAVGARRGDAQGRFAFACIYDLPSGAPRRVFTVPAAAATWDAAVQDLAFSPDGLRLAAVGGRQVRVVDIATGALLFQIDHQHWLSGGPEFCAVRFLPDGDRFLTGGSGLRLWSVAGGSELSWSADPLEAAGRHLALAADGRSVLSDAAGEGGQPLARTLLWTLPGERRVVDALPPARGGSLERRPDPPLNQALRAGDAERAMALLGRGADVRAMEGWRDRPGAVALHIAIGDETMLAALLAHGAPIDAPDEDRCTALHLAVAACAAQDGVDPVSAARALRVVEALLAHGADINARSQLWYQLTPLRTAARARDRALADLLIARGAEPDLTSLVMLDDLDGMRRMLTREPGLANRPMEVGYRPLYFARTGPCIDLLLACGAQLEARNARGETTVCELLGAGERFLDQVALLQARGADMQVRTGSGATAAGRLLEIERSRADREAPPRP